MNEQIKNLSYLEKRLLQLCGEKKMQKKDISEKTKNAPKGERAAAIDSLIEKGLLDFTKVTNKLTQRPVTFYFLTEKGKKYLQEFESWLDRI